MGITFDEKSRRFALETENTSYQIMVDEHNRLIHLYYGPKLYGAADYLITCQDRGFSANPYDAGEDRTYSLDALPQEYPTTGTGDFRSPALTVVDEQGVMGCDLTYQKHKIVAGKYALKGLPAAYDKENTSATLVITLEDQVLGLEVDLYYGVLEKTDVVTRAAVIRNAGEGCLRVEKALSANLDFVSGEYDLITFHGRHGMERNTDRQRVINREIRVGSRRGASSHQYNPLAVLAERDTTEMAGGCWGMQFVYSGGFVCSTEKDQYDQVRFQMGLAEYGLSYPLEKGEELIAPEVILSYSNSGLRQLSWNFADTIKEHVIRGPWQTKIRPVLLNSWEAFYMDFDGEKLRGLADEAKDLGMDMLVLDDGWFGHREDDCTSLGDWFVWEEKLGGSLRNLVDYVHEKDLLFGLWFEPEMVSEDSLLYRKHPDYALQIPGKKPVRGRYQLVLDFSRQEVVDAIYEQVSKVIEENDIDYVKWDYNRSIIDVYSAESACQGKVLYDYILGLYQFLERLHDQFPNILIEGCSGGGGRFDAGMLYYTPQIWCSDNTDAIDRLKIQYGTSFGYPAMSMGAHVSVSPNEQCGREVSLQTRSLVAMAGTYGYELDPGKMTEEEKEQVRGEIARQKQLAPLVMDGRYYRLSDPFTAPVTAWGFVSRDAGEAFFAAVVMEVSCNMPTRYVRFAGLEPHRFYRNEADGKVYASDALMAVGMPLPFKTGEYQSYSWHLELCGE
ncbi:alpha-galactosidase [Lachnospiraceae bacterium KHCPX20]|nr:alpha-galactosidase [Lachnospiraceae bacterium KHCPX20]